MTPSDLKFALDAAPRTVEWACRNLRSLAYEPEVAGFFPTQEEYVRRLDVAIDDKRRPRMPHLDRASAPAVLIVGAGPTLDLARVRAAHDAGVSIWTVNNAAKAVCSVVAPDVVVVRESLDVSPQLDDLAHRPKLIACDLLAHPNVWTKALSQGPAAFFIAATPQSLQTAAMLDVAPVYGGSASLTMAVALAAAGGAQWIGLEGVDLAYARDGRGYAEGARYQAALAGVDESGLGRLTGGDEQAALAATSGRDGPPKVQAMVKVHARDGGEHLYAQRPWVDQIEWLENFAARRPSGITSESCNALLARGHGLADLVGWPADGAAWMSIKLGAIQASGRVAPHYGAEFGLRTLEPDRVAPVLADIDRQLTCQSAINAACLAGEDPTKIPDLVEGSTICDVHSAGRREVAGCYAPDALGKLAATYGEFQASVDRLTASG